jgi:hypothetical protein
MGIKRLQERRGRGKEGRERAGAHTDFVGKGWSGHSDVRLLEWMVPCSFDESWNCGGERGVSVHEEVRMRKERVSETQLSHKVIKPSPHPSSSPRSEKSWATSIWHTAQNPVLESLDLAHNCMPETLIWHTVMKCVLESLDLAQNYMLETSLWHTVMK